MLGQGRVGGPTELAVTGVKGLPVTPGSLNGQLNKSAVATAAAAPAASCQPSLIPKVCQHRYVVATKVNSTYQTTISAIGMTLALWPEASALTSQFACRRFRARLTFVIA